MDKIIKALLGAKYPTANTEALLEVINATPNPTLATEIMCGLYVPVTVHPMSHISKDKPECRIKSYDKWTDTVNYEYLAEETVHMYLPEDLDTNTVTLDNYKDLAVSWKSDGSVKSFRLKTGKQVKETGTTNLEKWESGGYFPDSMVH